MLLARVVFANILVEPVEAKGFGGLVKFSPPSNISTTVFMEGRSTGFHWTHHNPTVASFVGILPSPSPIWILGSSPSSRRL
ncbi:hypothetical protein L3X38_012115 [Prunus dulcis]|uniref:Uncharacterized protein n=1 Tax=Prunus dulcis TaxID=3755 RepID=A0AAD4WIP5_PRUDU|nr:hypothetical protein L3X38_012115 [Prunus dulcis]